MTSSGTLDKANSSAREHLAKQAELLGAVRLPNNAFQKNAGTEVTTDIIFLQKREQPIEIENMDADWIDLEKTEDGIPINAYFAAHPDMVLGTMAYSTNMYGNENDTACIPIEGADLKEQLHAAMQNIVIPERPALSLDDLAERNEIERTGSPVLVADSNVRNYSYVLATPVESSGIYYAQKLGEGELYFRENEIMNPVILPQATLERAKGMIVLRDDTRALIAAQMENASDEAIQSLQNTLSQHYDQFTQKHGLINTTGNRRAFENDDSYSLLCSLEHIDEDGNLERKADIFTKRTIQRAEPASKVNTASEALAVSIGERAKVDINFMQSLLGKPVEDMLHDLESVIFKIPGDAKDDWVTADEYLSGNVREKLKIAKMYAERSPEFAVNVSALEKVQPKDLVASDIEVRLGAQWVDLSYYQAFIDELLQLPEGKHKIEYSPASNLWNISNKTWLDSKNVPANITYGTKRRNALALVEESLNQRDVRVYDTKVVDNKEVRELNVAATEAAKDKQAAIKDAFATWIFKDPERRHALCKDYNERFNSIRPRDYDGKHIRFEGMNPEITLLPHQNNAVARQLYGGNTLLAHCVGAGKTFEMIAAAMESKRLGLANKSLFVVPNHLTQQWATEFYRLYPGANILVATKKDFEKENRKKFCSRIATGEYDAVIIGHSQFERIPISPERQRKQIQEQISDISEAIQQAYDSDSPRFTIKQLERTKKALHKRLESLSGANKKDHAITFEELGVDRLFVDEAHSYKNLFTYTKMRNVAGIGQAEAQKSSDMFAKCRYMDEITDGRGIIFATGTPVSNSMVELYTMMRYLQYDMLENLDLLHFDNWAAQFGETVAELEIAPEGGGLRAKTRFARFFNLPELMNIWKETTDIQTADMLKLEVPDVEYVTETIKPSELQRKIMMSFTERAEYIRRGSVDPKVDNMLKITNDGRKLALDQRLHSPMLKDEEHSKVNKVVDNVFSVWSESKDKLGTQLVFSDLSTPKKNGIRKALDTVVEKIKSIFSDQEESAVNADFNVYDDIKQKLIAKGIPENEIAYIHDANNDKQKAELFAKVRSGSVRVLLGSTSKMGAGTNVQDKLCALHHVDCPWKPSDIEQREGRIIRRGNLNKSVKVFRYVTEGTFDAYSWNIIEKKQKFIGQIMTSKSPVRTFEDTDAAALSFAEVKALATGDPRFMEKVQLDSEVAKLKMRKSSFQSQQHQLEDNLAIRFPAALKQNENKLSALKQDFQMINAAPVQGKEGFHGMEIQNRHYDDKALAGEALLTCSKDFDVGKENTIGHYRGFELSLSFNSFSREMILDLKGQQYYSVPLGDSVRGNISRINNALEKLPEMAVACEKEIANIQSQIQNAQLEVGKSFPYEEELAEKSKKLRSLDRELLAINNNSNEKSSDEKNNDEKKSSIKDKLAAYVAPAAQPSQHHKDRER